MSCNIFFIAIFKNDWFEGQFSFLFSKKWHDHPALGAVESDLSPDFPFPLPPPVNFASEDAWQALGGSQKIGTTFVLGHGLGSLLLLPSHLEIHGHTQALCTS